MKKIVFVIIVLLNIKCRESNSSKADRQILKDSTKQVANYIGKWGGLDEKIPVWNIMKDSIYYYQHNRYYSYSYISGDLIIDFNGSKGVLKNIHTVLDTLIFQDEQGNTIRGYKFH